MISIYGNFFCLATNAISGPNSKRHCCRLSIIACSRSVSTNLLDSGKLRNSKYVSICSLNFGEYYKG